MDEVLTHTRTNHRVPYESDVAGDTSECDTETHDGAMAQWQVLTSHSQHYIHTQTHTETHTWTYRHT